MDDAVTLLFARGVQCVLLHETTWYCLFWLRVQATQFSSVQSTCIRIMLTFLFYKLKSSHPYGKGLISLFFYSVLSNWNAKGRLYKWKLDYDHKSLPCVWQTQGREWRMKKMNIWVKWHRSKFKIYQTLKKPKSTSQSSVFLHSQEYYVAPSRISAVCLIVPFWTAA